ncbi:hypothetical protein [Nonomuraea sp. NEAU-A123]|uniref:hypothetical protein n=1 Tax=Nonomuraea sp. NEAU-A123 TaxID=2839649 RepID=UPI001BE4CAB5|nr:hypothetical protein [Nonomuraea sp. NEAU-A123]MBT2234107.1 hypothetical protein [Nonomuraea sp. NEAU-A123]
MKPLAVVVLFAVLGVTGIGVGAFSFFASHGCGSGEDRLAQSLAAHGIFAQRPSGARPQGERTAICDVDDRIVDVEQVYRLPDAGKDVFDFYREVAVRDGWEPSSEEEDASGFCFTKAIADKDVDLSVSVDKPDMFYVRMSSSVDGGGWC